MIIDMDRVRGDPVYCAETLLPVIEQVLAEFAMCALNQRMFNCALALDTSSKIMGNATKFFKEYSSENPLWKAAGQAVDKLFTAKEQTMEGDTHDENPAG